MTRIVLVTGAKKNAGDYLIRERAVAIFRERAPSAELVLLDRWDATDASTVAGADGVVFCGGPALSERFVPDVQPLAAHLDAIDAPVFSLALGWFARRPDVEAFSFTAESEIALRHLNARTGWIGVRDDLSASVVRHVGEDMQVRMTGCVAWYSLPHLEAPIHEPTAVERVVVTTPARPGLFPDMVRLMAALRRRFPRADRRCVFHRGIRSDRYTNRRVAARNIALAAAARALGYDVVDASYGTDHLRDYATTDLHVGYRVHAHLAFISMRRPSVLISEDARGFGQAVTLGDPYVLDASQDDVVSSALVAVRTELTTGFPALQAAVRRVDAGWPSMRGTVDEILARSGMTGEHRDEWAAR